MGRKNVSAIGRSPIGFLTIALVMNFMGLAALAWYSYDAYCDAKEARGRDLRIEQLRGKIVHLDEVLTMSARMAAATGDLFWEDRYRRFEPELDAAIKEALVLTPDTYAGDAAAETAHANVRLVEMENRSFELVRGGRPDEGKAILFSDEYKTQKRLYAKGMAKLSDSLSNALDASIDKSRRHALVDTAAVILLAPLLILGWVMVLRATRRWQATLQQNSRRFARQSEELRDVNRSLDERIHDRTKQLQVSQIAALNMMQDAEEARRKAEQANGTLRGEVADRERAEEELQNRTHDLGQRVKELNCLYGISKIIEDGDITAGETIRKMLAIIPPSWQYPEVACARLILNGKAFETDNFEETVWKQSSAILVGQLMAGALEVCYLQEMPQEHQGPFLREETALIDGITERLGMVLQRQEIEAEANALKQQMEFILGATKTGLHIMDPQGNMRYADPKWQELYGDPTGQTCCDYLDGRSQPCGMCGLADALETKKITVAEKVLPKEGNRPVQVTSIPFQNEQGEWLVAQVNVDISERKRMEAELAQAQKLESIGQLAAGIAHEINTPSQYIGDNTRFLREAFEDLDRLLGHFDRLLQAAKGGRPSDELTAEVETAIEEADLEYLTEEIPKAIRQSQEGIDRVATIVRAMKEFSHPGGEQKQAIDLNRAIENTVTVSRNEWKYVADLTTDFDPALPPVSCHPSEINQVILNVIVNAAQAIGEAVGESPQRKGAIGIRSRRDGDFVEIRIADNGPGIPEEDRSKVFDHFFTTKEVGKGTGQGLTIAHSIVVEKHGGAIDFETESGKGTTFIVRLPIADSNGSPSTRR